MMAHLAAIFRKYVCEVRDIRDVDGVLQGGVLRRPLDVQTVEET